MLVFVGSVSWWWVMLTVCRQRTDPSYSAAACFSVEQNVSRYERSREWFRLVWPTTAPAHLSSCFTGSIGLGPLTLAGGSRLWGPTHHSLLVVGWTQKEIKTSNVVVRHCFSSTDYLFPPPWPLYSSASDFIWLKDKKITLSELNHQLHETLGSETEGADEAGVIPYVVCNNNAIQCAKQHERDNKHL